MRVLELLDSLAVGGAERMAVALSLRLQELRHFVQFACLRDGGRLEEPLDAAGIGVVKLRKPEGWSNRTLRDLTDLCRAVRPDVVHSHNPLVHHYAVAAARRAGVPVVVNTLHGIHNIERATPAALLYAGCAWLSGAVVTVCRRAEQHFRALPFLPARRIVMIYNGIPLEPFLAIPPRAAAGDFTFGAVGRLVDVKDHATLLRAFARVAQEHPRVRLEILGGGPLRERLESLIAELGLTGRAVLRGESLDVAGFLRGVDVYVHSSVTEALPMTLLEAMGAGLPVAATAVGGLPELVEAADCGWLAPPRQPEALAAALAAALADAGRAARGARGRAFVAAHCSAQAMAAQYLALFERLLEARR